MALLPAGEEAGRAAEQLIEWAKSLRKSIDAYAAQCDAGSLSAFTFLDDFNDKRLIVARGLWPTYSAVTGVQAIIRQRVSGFADDAAVTTQLAAVQTAMDTLIAYIGTNVSTALTDAGGWIQVLKRENNAFVHRTITNATQLGNLKTALLALKTQLTA